MTETRETIEAEIADARRARGFAHLHGKKFDDSIIAALNQKLETIDDAAAEQTRQQRTEAGRKYEAEVTALRTEKADAATARMAARREAEAKFREAVDAAKREILHAAAERDAQMRMNRLTGERGGAEGAGAEGEIEHIRQLSLLVASQVRSITKHPARFGILTFPNTLPDPNKSWS
jgi:hypothetical protein